jgi:uncharacterized protein with gpF-like domain
VLKREKEVFGYLLDTEEAVMKELEKQYRKALKDIEACIKVMQADELTQSRMYRLEYQKTLKKQVEAILEKLHSDEYTTMQQYLSGTYTDAYVGTVYALHGQSVPVLMPIDQKAAVKAVMTDSKISTDLYTHLGVDITKLKKTIRNEITRGVASGMLYQDIARNVAFNSNITLNRAKNIVQTEGHRIQEASAHDARHHAISRGADLVKQWDSTLDGATRDTHRRLDGQIREVDEPFEMDGKEAQYPGDFGDPAEDCRCRCVALSRARSALDEAGLKTMKERAAFWDLDKTENFEDFKKKYLKATNAENNEKHYNSNTMKGQYKLTEAMNEYDYFDMGQEEFRLAAIKELSGADDERALEYLDALCGRREDYIRASNNGAEYKEAWFYGADAKIRAGATDHFRQQAQTIHDYIARSPKFEGEIYRGLSLPGEQIAKFKKGAQFQENGLLSSWTSSYDVADMFANGRSEELGTTPVIIKMKNPRYGTPVSHLSIFGQEEQEVLVSNIENATFTIGDVTENGGMIIIELLE